MDRLKAILHDITEESLRPLVIKGHQKLHGTIEVQSSKNSTNRLLVVTAAVPGIYTFHKFPFILDPLRVASILEFLGAKIMVDKASKILTVDSRSLQNRPIPYELTKTTTGAFGLAGALLGRFGSVDIGKPGGDEIGPRPVNYHIEAFVSLGAEVEEFDSRISARLTGPANNTHRMATASIGASVNYILAAAGSNNQHALENMPNDSDMEAFLDLLDKVGVQTTRHQNTLTINPGTQKEVILDFDCPPDINAAMTWVAYGALSEGISINNMPIEKIERGLQVYESIGAKIKRIDNTTIEIARGNPPEHLELIAGYGDLFHSDWLAPMQTVLCVLGVRAKTIDTLFPQRIRQAEILKQMGANIEISGGKPPNGISLVWKDDPEKARYIVDISEKRSLHGIEVAVGNDVRCTAAILLATLCANGTSVLSDISALYRGYENIASNLSAIGVDIV